MESKFYGVISRMKLINRWGLMRGTRNETISEHSLETAVIAHALALISNKYFGGSIDAERCAVMGIFHDATEIITGDMPTPVKYFSSDIRGAYKAVEENARDRLVSLLPDELKDDYKPLFSPDNDCGEEEMLLWKFVKAADKISALIKCIDERMTGNTDFLSAENATLNAVRDMNMPEADFFINNFISGYGCTLDEQLERI